MIYFIRYSELEAKWVRNVLLTDFFFFFFFFLYVAKWIFNEMGIFTKWIMLNWQLWQLLCFVFFVFFVVFFVFFFVLFCFVFLLIIKEQIRKMTYFI